MANSVSGGDIGLHVCTFLLWTTGVAVITWFICRRYLRTSAGAADDYFAGGRALAWYVVAGSLMLTNLSTEQLVGLNGVIFADGCLAGTAWETFAALAMLFTATVFLPRYMQSGLTTTTGFLGERFDLTTRSIVSTVFLVYYTVGLCPSVLYTGALAIRKIFDLDDVPLWTVSFAIGFLGACYAIFGGLKAVAVSDCLNGVGLIVVGLWVPLAGLQKLGGLSALFEDPKLLLPLVATSEVYDNDTHSRSPGVPTVPWHVLLTGLMLVNLYYWSMNQLIVQRALAAKSLAQGQKGVLFAASMKVVGFTFLCLPGIIGILMMRKGVVVNGKPFSIEKSDDIYGEMVKAVMPKWALGFFGAVLLGSILSTFNSALNSASTLFGLEIYKVYINPDASEERTVKVASAFGASLTVASWIIAPQLQHIQSIYDFLQRVKTLASLPIITIFLVGVFTVRPDAFSAKFGFCVGAVAYLCGQFVPDDVNFLHVFFACFVLALASIAVATYTPALRTLFRQVASPKPYTANPKPMVDVTPWRWMYMIACWVTGLVAVLTFALQIGSMGLFIAFWVLWIAAVLALMALPCTGTGAPAAATVQAKAEAKVEAQADGNPEERNPEERNADEGGEAA